MTPRVRLRSPRSLALAAGLILSLGVCATSAASAAEGVAIAGAGSEFAPGADRSSARPPATLFSINAVLARLDAQRGRGTDAVRLAALPRSDTATDAPNATKEATPVGAEPFGLFTFRAPDGLLWRKWRGVEAALVKEQAVLDQCRADAANCAPHAAQFLRLINAVSSKSGREKLDEANRNVNAAIHYVSDLAQHGEADRWSAPLATFASGKGDCEDYAIAKFVALRLAGVAPDALRIVIVHDPMRGEDHAIAAAKLDGRWLTLDNRRMAMIEDGDAKNYRPLFVIDRDGAKRYDAVPLLAGLPRPAPPAVLSIAAAPGPVSQAY